MAAIQSEYAQYNIRFTYTDYTGDFVFTTDMLDQQLKRIRETLNNSNYDANTQTFVHRISSSVHGASSDEQNLTRSLPVERTYTLSKSVVSPSVTGSASLQISVTALEDIQSGNFISVLDVTSRQHGLAVNFKSWTQNSHSLRVESSPYNWRISGQVHGTLVVEYTIPAVNVVTTYSSDHSIDCVIESGSH